jgi:hypothetical protein
MLLTKNKPILSVDIVPNLRLDLDHQMNIFIFLYKKAATNCKYNHRSHTKSTDYNLGPSKKTLHLMTLLRKKNEVRYLVLHENVAHDGEDVV